MWLSLLTLLLGLAAAPGPAAGSPPGKGGPAPRARPAPEPSGEERALEAIQQALESFRLGARFYIHYRYGQGETADHRIDTRYNEFRISRGFLSVWFTPTRWFSARVTPNVRQEISGDWGLRLQYLLARFTLPVETAVVSDPFVEYGLVPDPWLDFAERVNAFRMQGTLFAERQSLVDTSDLGITAGVLLGRRLPAGYRRRVSPHWPGTWGSMVLGVYNGSGARQAERNLDKVVRGRLTVRPLGGLHPNLQLSYHFAWGRGNLEEPAPPPRWELHGVMASYEHRYGVATLQMVTGQGTFKGQGAHWLVAPGRLSDFLGASGFVEARIPPLRSSVITRVDWFDGPNPSGLTPYWRFIAGWAVNLLGQRQAVLLLDVEYSLLQDAHDEWAVTLTLQAALGTPSGGYGLGFIRAAAGNEPE